MKAADLRLAGRRIAVIAIGRPSLALACARVATRAGATVAVAGESVHRLAPSGPLGPAPWSAHTVDVGDPTSVRALFTRIGRFDRLVVACGDGTHRHAALALVLAESAPDGVVALLLETCSEESS